MNVLLIQRPTISLDHIMSNKRKAMEMNNATSHSP